MSQQNEESPNLKDELIRVTKGASNRMLNLEEMDEAHLERLGKSMRDWLVKLVPRGSGQAKAGSNVKTRLCGNSSDQSLVTCTDRDINP